METSDKQEEMIRDGRKDGERTKGGRISSIKFAYLSFTIPYIHRLL